MSWALIKWLNPAVGLVCKCFKSSRDLFANFLSLSPLHCGDGVLAPYCLAGRPRHAAAGSLSAAPPLAVVKNATMPPTCLHFPPPLLLPLTCPVPLLPLAHAWP